MLVLSRKPGEKVIIGKDITLQVVEIIGNRVRLGISAPSQVEILREELCTPNFLVESQASAGAEPARGRWDR